MLPAALVAADLNRDGVLDLVVVDGGSANGAHGVLVLLGKSDGTFHDPVGYGVGQSPVGLAVGDLNRDGIQDLAVVNSGTNDVSLLLGNGDGTFGPATNFLVGTAPASVALGDFNRDGTLDVATANRGSDDVSALPGNGDGTLGADHRYAAHDGPIAIVTADANGDGTPDLAVANSLSDDVSVLIGSGSGTFAAPLDYPVNAHALALAAADINSDGLPDFLVPDSTGGVNLLLSAPDSTPPVITPSVSGWLGNDGWYRNNVAVGFDVQDQQTFVMSTSGCDLTALTADTAGSTYTCQATSGGGTSSASVTVKRDATPPIASTDPTADQCDLPGLNGWCRGTQTAGFSATDAMSGMASPCSALSGSSCAFTRSTTTNGSAVVIASGQVCDVAGNCATGIAAGPYKIDSVAPETTITRGPGKWTAVTAVTFRFKSSEPASRFLCKLDDHPWRSCKSPKTYRWLKLGRHIFRVGATDPAGNPDATPAIRSWKIVG